MEVLNEPGFADPKRRSEPGIAAGPARRYLTGTVS